MIYFRPDGEDDEEDDEDDESSKLTVNRDSEFVDSLKKLLDPGDLDLIRNKIFGQRKIGLLPRNEKSIKGSRSQSEEEREKKFLRKVVERQELEKLKSRALKDNIRTILEPGQLDELKETGIWNLTRVKKSEGTSSRGRIRQLLRELLSNRRR